MLSLLAALALAAPVPNPGPEWVTLKGRVVWPEKAKVPEAKGYDLSVLRGGDAEYIQKGPAVFDEPFVVDPKTLGLKDVIVWLRPDDDDPKAAFPKGSIHPDLVKPKAKTHTVTNEFCQFDKRTLAVRVGDSVKWVNKGAVHLAVRLDVGDDDNSFTLARDKDPVTTELTKAGSGGFVDLLHQWKVMHWPPGTGRIRVFDHPYFAVTDDKGRWEIPQVPRGKWRVVYSHERGLHKGKDGWLGFPAEVKGGEKAEMTLDAVQYEPPKREK